MPAREAMVSDTRDRSRDKATLPKQLSGRACQEARCCFWKTVFRGWASGFSAFHLQRRKVVASGSSVTALPKSAVCKCEKHTQRHQILTLVFKDTIGGCSHSPCFLDRKQHIKRKEGGRAGRLSRFCKGSCNHQGFFLLLRVH